MSKLAVLKRLSSYRKIAAARSLMKGEASFLKMHAGGKHLYSAYYKTGQVANTVGTLADQPLGSFDTEPHAHSVTNDKKRPCDRSISHRTVSFSSTRANEPEHSVASESQPMGNCLVRTRSQSANRPGGLRSNRHRSSKARITSNRKTILRVVNQVARACWSPAFRERPA